MDLSTGSDELSEIIELPSLETEYDTVGMKKEFVFMDCVDWWGMYQLPWLQNTEDCDGFIADELAEPTVGITHSFDF